VRIHTTGRGNELLFPKQVATKGCRDCAGIERLMVRLLPLLIPEQCAQVKSWSQAHVCQQAGRAGMFGPLFIYPVWVEKTLSLVYLENKSKLEHIKVVQ